MSIFLAVLVVQKEWMDTPCWAIIGALSVALVSVTVWGVKQAKDGRKILREWLDETREQLRFINLVDNANRDRR